MGKCNDIKRELRRNFFLQNKKKQKKFGSDNRGKWDRKIYVAVLWEEIKTYLKLTRLPVTRWVKLSLNFELLVPK